MLHLNIESVTIFRVFLVEFRSYLSDVVNVDERVVDGVSKTRSC
jgi:hypothetical protein